MKNKKCYDFFYFNSTKMLFIIEIGDKTNCRK